MNKIIITAIILIASILSIQCQADEDTKPPAIGNFALPPSQQPTTFISFGQNIFTKNELQILMFADSLVATHSSHATEIVPEFLYEPTDNLNILFSPAYALSYKSGPNKSSGFEDALLQFEYAYYNKSTSQYQDQFTVVGNVAAPTGSIDKNPPTGTGSPSFFLGTTFNRTYVYWYYFVSPGVTLTTAKDGTKFGNSLLYQAGIGRNIAVKNGWAYALLLEGDGTYTQKTRYKGLMNPNSGGNVFYLSPSMTISNKNLLLQFGVGYAVAQSLNGNQPNNTYLFAADVGWSFY